MVEELVTFLTSFILVLFLFSLVSRRIESMVVTAPMVFLIAGLIFGPAGLDIVGFDIESGNVLLIAEVALVFTLFSDASRINIRALKGSSNLPARMLGIGLPLTILAGTAVALVIFSDMTLIEAGILSCLLAPTDAALGEEIVSSEKVPLRIRQALNVEAGLNDGAVIPALTALVTLYIGEARADMPPESWLISAAFQIVIAVLAGSGVGFAGGWLLVRAESREWIGNTYKWISLMSVAFIAWVVTDILGASGFIAAFVAGLTSGAVYGNVVESLVDFTEAEGEILAHLVFFLLGVVAYLPVQNFNPALLLYALLSLTVIRMLPVAISLTGTHLKMRTVLFMGWFGPRGLASIVLLISVIENIGNAPGMETLALTVITTVILSVFAHGISANPGIARYARHAETLHEEAPEKKPVAELPGRKRRVSPEPENR